MPTKQFAKDSVYFRRVAGATLSMADCERHLSKKNWRHAYVVWHYFYNIHNGLNYPQVAEKIKRDFFSGIRGNGISYGEEDGNDREEVIYSHHLQGVKTLTPNVIARHWVTLLWEKGYLEPLPEGFLCHCGKGWDCEEDSEAEEEPLPPPPKAEEVRVPRTGRTFHKAKPAAPRAPEGGVVAADHPDLLAAMAAARRALAACDAVLAKAK